MPRGVYDRSKAKAKKTGAVVTAPVVAKSVSAAPAKATKAKATKTAKATADQSPVKATREPTADEVVHGFSILNNAIGTLAQSASILGETSPLIGAINQEIEATIQTMTALRLSVFGHLLPSKEETNETVVVAPVAEEVAPTHVAAPQLPVTSGATATGTLPQGNASYVPPAPPVLPHH